jgi:endonuclease YncB( thermonuclease family)
MFRTFIYLTVIAVFSAIGAVAQQPIQSGVKASKVVRVRGSVLTVEDSDRVKVATDEGSVVSVLLQGIDAPDEKQSFYKKARKRLAELVEGKEVTVILRTNDGGEPVAVVYVGGEDVGLRLLQDGLAWYSARRGREQNIADRNAYIQAENLARTAKVGLWDDKAPVAPWTFRGESAENIPAADKPSTIAEPSATQTPAVNKHPERTYILGPRGGCYYLNDQGIKVYVKDKSLCNKPQD